MESFDELIARSEAIKQEENGGKTQEEILAEQEAAKLAEEAEAEKLKQEAEAKVKTGEGEEEQEEEFLKLLKVEKPAEAAKVEIPEDVKQELESYKSKLSLYENDPLHKAISLGANREELLTIAAELKGKDFSKTSYRDLLSSEIQQASGIEGEELEEALEQALLEHTELPSWKQKAQENELRKKFETTAKKGDSPTLSAIESAYLEASKGVKTPEQFQKEMQETAQAEKSAILDFGKKLVGSKLYGVEFTLDMLNNIVEKDYDVQNIDKEFLDEKGDLKIADFIQKKFTSKALPDMIAWAKAEGAKEAKKGTAAVGGTGKASAPIVAETKNAKKEDLKGLMPDYIIEQLKD